MSSPGIIPQPLLVSASNLKTINSTSLLGSGDIVVGSSTIVGITGTKAEFDTACTDGNFAYQSDLASYATTSAVAAAYVPRIVSVDNQVVRFDGTGGAVQGSPGVTIDDSGVLTVAQIQGGLAVVKLNDTVGASCEYDANYQRVNATNIVGLASGYSFEVGGTWNGATLRKTTTYVSFDFNAGIGEIRTSNVSYLSQAFQIKSYNNIELSPGGSLSGPGTYVEINNGTPGQYRDLKMRDLTAGAITASGSIKPGTKTIATLPSAASSDGERYRCSDSATTTGRLVYSNGTAWYYENGTAV